MGTMKNILSDVKRNFWIFGAGVALVLGLAGCSSKQVAEDVCFGEYIKAQNVVDVNPVVRKRLKL